MVKIDTAVFNPARITKLYGTMTHKGANTSERPHRKSAILRFPSQIQLTSMDLVRNIASACHKAVQVDSIPTACGNSSFNFERFLSEHAVQVAKKVAISNGIKYQLVHCPFDTSHVNGDAAVFAYSNGRFGFHCFHNSCSGYHWHEFREKIDPMAYANTPFTLRHIQSENAAATEPDAAAQRKPRMLDIASIPSYDRSKIVVIQSRFATLDAKIGGFNKGELSIWSGANASGKSTLVSQLGLEAITGGFKATVFSGEMTASRVREWVLLQAAGPNNVMPDPMAANHYCLKPGIERKLDMLLNTRLRTVITCSCRHLPLKNMLTSSRIRSWRT